MVWSAATAGLPLAAIAAVGLLVYSPFYFGTLATQVQMPPIAPVDYGARPIHFLTVWGLFMLLGAAFMLSTLYSDFRYRVARPWRALTGSLQWFGRPEIEAWLLGLAGVLLPYVVWAAAHLEFNEGARQIDLLLRLWTVAPLGLAVRARAGKFGPVQFALMLVLIATYLLYGAELLHVNDFFGHRMNTVFKFYYQCWILLSLVCAFGLWRWRAHHIKLSGWRLAASPAACTTAWLRRTPRRKKGEHPQSTASRIWKRRRQPMWRQYSSSKTKLSPVTGLSRRSAGHIRNSAGFPARPVSPQCSAGPAMSGSGGAPTTW